MKDLDSHQDIRVYTHNDTDKGYAERRDTRQSAARPAWRINHAENESRQRRDHGKKKGGEMTGGKSQINPKK